MTFPLFHHFDVLNCLLLLLLFYFALLQTHLFWDGTSPHRESYARSLSFAAFGTGTQPPLIFLQLHYLLALLPAARDRRIQNERWDRKWLPWRRVPPSTPLAKYPIVILWDGKSKEEMEEVTSNAFAERGVLPHRTKVGRDVVFRRGNPCNAHDVREQHVFIHFNV